MMEKEDDDNDGKRRRRRWWWNWGKKKIKKVEERCKKTEADVVEVQEKEEKMMRKRKRGRRRSRRTPRPWSYSFNLTLWIWLFFFAVITTQMGKQRRWILTLSSESITCCRHLFLLFLFLLLFLFVLLEKGFTTHGMSMFLYLMLVVEKQWREIIYHYIYKSSSRVRKHTCCNTVH